MTKLNWDRPDWKSTMNLEYWTNPKTGFDNAWHEQRNKLKQNLGIHEAHDWAIINKPTGPHAGKVICNTCNGKFVSWLPKGYISTNT